MEKQRGSLPDRPLIGLLPPASTSRKPKPVVTMVKPLNSEAHSDNFRKQASLTMSAVSSTFRAHCSMHSEKSAISLSLKVLPFQP